MSSPRSSEHFRSFYKDASRGLTFLASETPTTIGADFIAVKNSSYQIYVQRIVVNVSTVAAQAITFQDDAGTPVVVGVLAASAAQGAHDVLDGEAAGIPITQGKNLEFVGTAGVAGSIYVECYQKLVGPVAVASTN